jgi:hypothetical protein
MHIAKLQHRCNDAFFSTIDTEAKAYVLGWLTTDGCIYANGQIRINLGFKDRDHLELLRSVMGIESPVREYKSTYTYKGEKKPSQYCALFWVSRQMVADLIALGVTPRKSLTVQAWQGPDHLMRHYWRGVVEGDGSIQLQGEREPSVYLKSTESVVRAFATFAKQSCDSQAKPRPDRNTWTITFAGVQQVQNILHSLYDNAAFTLARKKAIVDSIFVLTDARNTRFITFNGETMCVSDWAKRIGMSKQSLAARLAKGRTIEDTLTNPKRPRFRLY